jgi:aminoglycoside phosphotransferase family enzyme/predicted kinase
MVVDDQQGVIQCLGSLADERIETHSAIVFLSGTRAWKLKRAVLFDYLDFSTVERRRQMCEAEVRLNRRTAPSIYRGVVAVTRESDGTLALGGTGAPVDWVVEMNRFDQRELGDRRAAAGTLDIDTVDRLATVIAGFHAAAEIRTDYGGRDSMAWVVDGNAAGFKEFGSGFLDRDACERLTQHTHTTVWTNARLLDSRRQAGFVRQCHGDLHLRNIVLVDGMPTLFDAVEFNDMLACIDVWYDFAFLVMDLLKRTLPAHANVLFNRYLADSNDLDGVALAPLFLSCRAAIRAKTSATAAALVSDVARRRALQQMSAEYLAMAEQFLAPAPPRLVALGGLSGSGKSTVAAQVAPAIGRAPGAAVIRSDELRKAICGVPRLTRLGPEGYTDVVSRRVYAALATRAAQLLGGGHCVIVDAVWARQSDREAIERVAAAAGVPFVGLWLDAPETVLIDRVGARRDDPSDADANVIRLQARTSRGVVHWPSLDAARPVDAVAADVRAHVDAAQVPSCRR